MVELSVEDILRNEKANDPNSITSVTLSHKALSYVSCLSSFYNLERLDLSFNSLTTLKGLESCLKLKWLSVHDNKLHTLKGIEALSNLTVLNAGKNQLRSMDEVKNLVKLCALILNDNEIASISGLDQLVELNTLVLSRNPIREVGVSLDKLKSIVKISLSNCQLEDIGNSFKACTGLEQLRLAHNNIQTLPAELANNKKLQILDLGNNVISRWSDIEVLSSFHNLKNLNLHGNPIAEKIKLVKKVKKLAPSLQILNSKRMDKLISGKDQKVEHAVASELKPKKTKDPDVKSCDASPDKDANQKPGMKLKVAEPDLSVKDHMKKGVDSRKGYTGQVTEGKHDVVQNDGDNGQKKGHMGKKVPSQEVNEAIKDRSSKRKAAHLDAIDDKETPFADIVAYDTTESMKPNNGQRDRQAVAIHDAMSPVVTYPAKKKKGKNQVTGASALQFLTPDVGFGGPSAWSDGEE